MAKKFKTFAEFVAGITTERPWLSVDAVSFAAAALPVAIETEERDRSGLREFGFGSRECRWRDRRDRRAGRRRGHRCGKK